MTVGLLPAASYDKLVHLVITGFLSVDTYISIIIGFLPIDYYALVSFPNYGSVSFYDFVFRRSSNFGPFFKKK